MARIVRFSISHIDFLRKSSVVAVGLLTVVFLPLVLPVQPSALGQTTSATLTGTVFDASGAVVPNATVTLKDEASGGLRSTVSNAEGYFTFASVPLASSPVTVEGEDFMTC